MKKEKINEILSQYTLSELATMYYNPFVPTEIKEAIMKFCPYLITTNDWN